MVKIYAKKIRLRFDDYKLVAMSSFGQSEHSDSVAQSSVKSRNRCTDVCCISVQFSHNRTPLQQACRLIKFRLFLLLPLNGRFRYNIPL